MENPINSLNGEVCIVTGSTQGLGEGIARSLAKAGARVVVSGRNEQHAEAIAADLRSSGHEATAISANVAERSDIKRLVEHALSTYGEINVLFNNAGINDPQPFLEVDEANFEMIMRVNALGTLMCMQEVAKQMIKQGKGGKIINTTSIAGRQGYADIAPYCASKAAVISLTQAAARELASNGITVNGIAPGVVVTPLWDKMEREMLERGVTKNIGEWMARYTPNILLGRASVPSDFAGLAIFLASSGSDYFTGQTFMMDGGMILV
ncbi:MULTISPECIES: glucose 1-dehydrogenase [unclassified Mesorhizobium]|uniref:SDR family NAD(P)-dependent oxidoreductase n=1 Tax=unclassified Mesorhizobium TaxID=325217 RepID=UPI002414E9A8|nr:MULTISPECIES: glucose 1-dehydrogenase [unclassified Mesorhizobium]MDG4889968.1 glucose 1-dehydrogenase [Mesorhizobium sp. WSM4887]MDG4904111.1 glucose 1-dehydrogenase [Mesorhizobium sp. WSM4962]MDG4909138.1 glucose 1-dehydrogenase [Mesorhizobium sp. WSM4898]MDG4921762.1 glucose 1-dehydrogenase [Mesorhizobium sp. WSM4989]